LAAVTPTDLFKSRLKEYNNDKKLAFDPNQTISEVFNVAFGERTTLKELVEILKMTLSKNDPNIGDIEISYGPNRGGDIPHSLASIEKASQVLNYTPKYDIKMGLIKATNWYLKNLG